MTRITRGLILGFVVSLALAPTALAQGYGGGGAGGGGGEGGGGGGDLGAGGGALPFTGLDLFFILLAGAALVGTGLVLKFRGRSSS